MRLGVDQVIVGERRRQDMGDIGALAESIARFGLLHPIVVDADGQLVAGHRRLLACVHLGWADIEARSLGELSDSERREIELEENLRRKDLTDYERSRNLAELAVTAEQVLADLSGTVPDKSARGRPRKPASKERVAERIGVDRGTVDNAHAHVETVEAYPFMQTWKQYQVLEAHEVLGKLPEQERASAVALIDQPATPVKTAIGMLRNLATKPTPDRRRIYSLAESEDSRDRSLALTEAAAMPAMPDPRLALLDDAYSALRKALRLFPDDPANTALTAALECVKSASAAVKGARRG